MYPLEDNPRININWFEVGKCDFLNFSLTICKEVGVETHVDIFIDTEKLSLGFSHSDDVQECNPQNIFHDYMHNLIETPLKNGTHSMKFVATDSKNKVKTVVKEFEVLRFKPQFVFESQIKEKYFVYTDYRILIRGTPIFNTYIDSSIDIRLKDYPGFDLILNDTIIDSVNYSINFTCDNSDECIFYRDVRIGNHLLTINISDYFGFTYYEFPFVYDYQNPVLYITEQSKSIIFINEIDSTYLELFIGDKQTSGEFLYSIYSLKTNSFLSSVSRIYSFFDEDENLTESFGFIPEEMNVGNYIAMAWAKNDNDKETSANFSFVVLPNQPIFHVNEVDRNYTKYVDSSIDLVVHVCYYEQININVYLFYDDIINMNEQQYIIIQKTYSKDSLYEDDINISVPITKNFDIGTNQIIFRVSAANDENKFSEDDISVQIYGSQPDMNFTIQKHHLYQYYNDKIIVSYNISSQIDESFVSIYYYIDNTNVSKPDNFKTLNHKSEIYSFIEEIPIPETIQFGTHKLIFPTCYEEFLCTTKEIEFIYSEYEYFPPNLDILEYNSRITRYKDSHLICRCKVYEKNEDSYVNVTATYQGDILNWTILNIDSESLELLDFEIPLSTKFNVGSNEIKICATNKYNMSNCSSIIVEAENPPPEIKVNPMRNYYYLQNEMNVFGYVLDYLAEENDENDVTIHASINNTEIGSTTAKITQTLMSYSYQIDLNINGYEQGFYQMKIIGINNLGKESNHIFHNFEFLAFSVKNVKQKSSSKIKMFLFGPLISK